jgi:hypothetical protein
MPDGFTSAMSGPLMRRPVAYLDWSVDGVALEDLFGPVVGTGFDYVSPLDEAWVEGAVEALLRLFGETEPDLPSGRTSLYVCPECGDLGCGAYTARVIFGQDVVSWSDVVWETDYSDESDDLDGVGPFVFARSARLIHNHDQW